jgi:hypothetical protein
MAGLCVQGSEKDECQLMERQIKEQRSLEACFRGGQGSPRAVAPFGRKEGRRSVVIRIARLQWAARVAGMVEVRMPRKITYMEPEGLMESRKTVRPVGR